MTAAAQADTNAEPSASEWSFKIAPYAWLAGTGGTVVTNGEETDFDLSFEDIFELTTGGFQINAQARHKRLFLTFDGTWATLGHGEDLLGGRVDFEVKQKILELNVGYRLIGPEFRSADPDTRLYEPGAVALDAYVGVSLLAHRLVSGRGSARLAAPDPANANFQQQHRRMGRAADRGPLRSGADAEGRSLHQRQSRRLWHR